MAAGSTYTPIATTTISGTGTSSITFNSFSGYTDLVLVVSPKELTSSDGGLNLRFNSDSGTNYSITQIYGDGSSAVSSRTSNQTTIGIYCMADYRSSANGLGIVNIMNYSNSSTYKTVLQRSMNVNDSNVANLVVTRVGLWRNTAAITSMTLTPGNGYNFASGSTATLYGIAAA
jgi:hypothetical protein